MKRILLLIAVFVAATFTGCKNEDTDKLHYDNKLYISSTDFSDEMLIKSGIKQYTRHIFAGIATPETHDIRVTFAVDFSLVDYYRKAYYEPEAIALSEAHYRIETLATEIKAGSVAGTPVTVEFFDTDQLDREQVYVLPVTIASAEGIEVLESARTMFYVFKGGALIDMVANISRNNFEVKWVSDVSQISVITVEALIRVSDFGAVGNKSEKISTLFGVEDQFLIRIGDSGFPENQVQLVYNKYKFPSSGDPALGLPTKQWVHVAVVWDGTTGERIIYHDGKQISYMQTSARGTVDLSPAITRPCYIGKAYNDLRWLEGDIAELRVWNVQRTAQELIDNRYTIDPESEEVKGKLYAYWKFDEGEGNILHDRSGNGNDAVAASDVKWVSVTLPESK